jgi:hypothetical protein
LPSVMFRAVGANKHLLFFSFLALAMTITAWTYGLLFNGTEVVHNLIVPASYLSLGMLVKYGDQACDEGSFSKRNAMLLAVLCGVWLGSFIAVDPGSATIFVGLLFGLLVARKYDSVPFVVGFGVALAIGLGAILAGSASLNLAGAIIVMIFTYVDERANDLPFVDEGRGWAAEILHHRPFIKMTILVLCLTGLLPSLMYFFAFMALDLGYIVVEIFSQNKEVPSFG